MPRRAGPTPPRGSARDALDDELRELYQGPLETFTPSRDALARRLKLAGDARHAEVKALRKPSLSAWAVNRLFAAQARSMTTLIDSGERARTAQARGTAKDAAALRAALDAIRDETAALLAHGRELSSDGGKPPGDAILERLRWNLDALALEPAAATIAARRWLDEDLAPPDFTILAALQVAAQGAKPARVPAVAAPAKSAGSGASATVHSFDRGRQAMIERRRREAEERRARARETLVRAESELVTRRGEADRATALSADAAREATAAQERALAARKAAHEAEAAAATAEAAVRRAREAVAAAERDR